MGYEGTDRLERDDLHQGDVCHGKPCIKGTRIWVSLILDFLASGSTVEEILVEYPQPSEESVRACIAYGAELARERYIPLVIGD